MPMSQTINSINQSIFDESHKKEAITCKLFFNNKIKKEISSSASYVKNHELANGSFLDQKSKPLRVKLIGAKYASTMICRSLAGARSVYSRGKYNENKKDEAKKGTCSKGSSNRKRTEENEKEEVRRKKIIQLYERLTGHSAKQHIKQHQQHQQQAHQNQLRPSVRYMYHRKNKKEECLTFFWFLILVLSSLLVCQAELLYQTPSQTTTATRTITIKVGK